MNENEIAHVSLVLAPTMDVTSQLPDVLHFSSEFWVQREMMRERVQMRERGSGQRRETRVGGALTGLISRICKKLSSPSVCEAKVRMESVSSTTVGNSTCK